MEDIKKPKAVYAKPKYYEEEEAQLVIEKLFLEPRHWRLFCLGALIGGFRRGEILALEWDNISFERSIIAINENIPLTRGGNTLLRLPNQKHLSQKLKCPSGTWMNYKSTIKNGKKKKCKCSIDGRGEIGSSCSMLG